MMSLLDLIDFRKFNVASSNVVHNFSVSETLFKRAQCWLLGSNGGASVSGALSYSMIQIHSE